MFYNLMVSPYSLSVSECMHDILSNFSAHIFKTKMDRGCGDECWRYNSGEKPLNKISMSFLFSHKVLHQASFFFKFSCSGN